MKRLMNLGSNRAYELNRRKERYYMFCEIWLNISKDKNANGTVLVYPFVNSIKKFGNCIL